MKYFYLLVLLFISGVSHAQDVYADLIVGTWKFEMSCDLRTEAEKNEFEEIPWCPYSTDNGTGYPIRTYEENGDYSDYFTAEHIEYGKWEIKKGILFLKDRISLEYIHPKSSRIENLKKKGLITQGTDGFYYLKSSEVKIKSLTENRLEFGNEKVYSIHERKKV